MRVLLTCGGTAGHINPAVAVASKLIKDNPNCEILFVGAQDRMETKLVPEEGFEISTVRITNLSRSISVKGLIHNFNTLRNVVSSTRQANRIIMDFKPDVVVGTGGYVCYPVLTAANALHIPTIIHESNAQPGLTTKLLAKKADRILVGFEHCREAYPDTNKVIVTGTPVRQAFYLNNGNESDNKTEKEDKPLVLSFWGSLGAEHMNNVMLNLFPLMKKGRFRLVHVTGSMYYKSFMERIAQICPDYSSYGVEIYEYLRDMPHVMKTADLVICRAGASTLSELTFIGKPSILVPSPNVTANHQEKNARMLEKDGAARVLLEGEFDAEKLLKEINMMISNREVLKSMGKSAAKLSQKDAAEKICCIIRSVAGYSLGGE
jgi:UDP-N-acetylglucosamine--N-acetylmuramyl-(pentapeptide) pyrophosphoryl-undecaprenol N-acetylglucosamine transferase